MADVLAFESQEAKLNSAIQTEVDAIRGKGKIVLPRADAGIVGSYVQKIQGTYDVDRAKKDTDNAIDLLYIAYNTTPQREGDIRVKITGLMNKLIQSQQKSQLTMQNAMHVATGITKQMDDFFPDWLDAKEGNDQAEIKKFVVKDLLQLATSVQKKALAVRDQLLAIAASYDDILKDASDATAKSETALSAQLADKAAVEKDINEANAKREQLESLVSDLKVQVANFEKKAREYESRANTAEQRAFVMSIVKVGAQMISSAVPAIAMVAGGPAGMLASGAMGALGGGGAAGQQQAAGGQRAPAGGGGPDQSAAMQTKLSEAKASQQAAARKQEEIKGEIKALQGEKAKLPAATPGAAGTGEAAELDRRIAAKEADLKVQDEAAAKQATVVSSIQDSLGALDKGLTKLSDEQQSQAATLRDMQMQMINKVESYEKERRDQSAELVKVTALLKGKQTEQETIQLAIKSLNVSLSALKRMKEIVEEVAFFFKSFADFMDGIATDAGHQAESISGEGGIAEMEEIRKNRLARLVVSVDEFFIRQTAQWNAVMVVSDRFNKSFAEGWSKLNKLSGTYITGDKLKAYLEEASTKLTAIVAERDAASAQKLASLDSFRKGLTKAA